MNSIQNQRFPCLSRNWLCDLSPVQHMPSVLGHVANLTGSHPVSLSALAIVSVCNASYRKHKNQMRGVLSVR